MQRVRRMQRDYVGNPIAPNPIPDDGEQLLELMDEALEHAVTAQGTGAGAFDHGMRLFNQFKAHFDLRVSKELASRPYRSNFSNARFEGGDVVARGDHCCSRNC